MKSRPLARLANARSVNLCALGLIFTIALGLSARAQTLPTVSSGTLLVQLKADGGVNVDGTGTNVTGWTDQSPNNYNFNPDIGGSGAGARLSPQLATNVQNGMPVVRFATNGILRSSGLIELFPTHSSPLTIFTAFTSPSTHNVTSSTMP
jgi:hypothetical protein